LHLLDNALCLLFFIISYTLFAMPITTRDKRGKRARENSKEVKGLDIQLGREARYVAWVRY
jgi:hypothetical protein